MAGAVNRVLWRFSSVLTQYDRVNISLFRFRSEFIVGQRRPQSDLIQVIGVGVLNEGVLDFDTPATFARDGLFYYIEISSVVSTMSIVARSEPFAITQ